MQIRKIGERGDGKLLGEDDTGALHVGTKRRAGWDEVVRNVTENGDGSTTIDYKVGEYLVSRAQMRTIPDDEMAAYFAARDAGENPVQPSGFSAKYHGYVAEKKFISVPMADGSNQEFERLIDVIEWEPLGD